MKTISKVLFQCDKCGKEIEYIPTNGYDAYGENSCWSIRLGQAGYGSRLDGSEVDFDLCDDCLCDFIKTFIHKDRIYNSGSNSSFDDEYDEYKNGD